MISVFEMELAFDMEVLGTPQALEFNNRLHFVAIILIEFVGV